MLQLKKLFTHPLSSCFLQLKKRRVAEEQSQKNRSLFIAKLPRHANEQDVKALVSQYGTVTSVNLFRAFQGAPTTKVINFILLHFS